MTSEVEPSAPNHSWRVEELENHARHFRGLDVQSRSFSNAYGSWEIMSIAALVEGILSIHDLVKVYEDGVLGMIKGRIRDLEIGMDKRFANGNETQSQAEIDILQQKLAELRGSTN